MKQYNFSRNHLLKNNLLNKRSVVYSKDLIYYYGKDNNFHRKLTIESGIQVLIGHHYGRED